MKQLSIKDIAQIAGVVPSTVSFVINGKEKEMRISEEMAKKFGRSLRKPAMFLINLPLAFVLVKRMLLV
ncbi:LacI family DNA-binding transcriptional regulator [Niabella ginsengisoli]|uniref:Helix-turn-helix domain-containing protein n=1 Tax=Niabella ginsengisoli TaxID=522298 RepID=A0ABS9SLD6_9BACT|nr:LacI family DNA-binding transcriptional regulator [Niabella ginsengisoli]MCH5599178.1 helix-turn-helix domain-containing protein [Niabella ginsengisoli]